MDVVVEVEESLRELRESFKSGRTRSVKWRKTQITALLQLLRDQEEAIFRALHQDLGKHPVESYRDEVGVVEKSAENTLSCVEKWMAPKKALEEASEEFAEHLAGIISKSYSRKRGKIPIRNFSHAALEPKFRILISTSNLDLSSVKILMNRSIRVNLACKKYADQIDQRKSHIPFLFFPGSGEVLSEPLGVVLIFSAWNIPIALSLDPLIGAISAGNVVVLKPSEHAPACSSFLAGALPQYLDSKAIKVIEGGSDVCEQLLLQKWDKIFFTGSPRVASIVMSAAAKNLTPVTLELGGKCPAILDSLPNPSDFRMAVKRIVGGKWGTCSGQACIGIDYVLVEEKFASVLVDSLKKIIRKFYGDDPIESKVTARIVNKHHFKRLCSLLEEPQVRASIVHGGSVDEENLFIEPTILLDPPLNAQIMAEEIFGPLLPIITMNNIQESTGFINSRPKPLAIYAFTKDEAFKRAILSETSSGSVTFNDTLVQFVCDALPFGGVGPSGIGRYHGKYSFETFSHEKAVMYRNLCLEIEPRYPPWNKFKLQFIRLAYKLNYVGLLLHMLGVKKHS